MPITPALADGLFGPNQAGGMLLNSEELPERFEESLAKNQIVPTMTAENLSSSEDEGDLDDEKIMNTIYQHYTTVAGDKAIRHTQATTNFVENVMQSGANTCLVCICSVRRNGAIWSCRHCFCSFHLNCIGHWARDSLAQLKEQISQQQNDRGYFNHMGEFVPPQAPRSLFWCCPQCRKKYTPEELPNRYECYCGKDMNPIAQPFLLPHSCGEICGKSLEPECGHKCMLLCHPGPCPPCCQTRLTSCICGKSEPQVRRCSNKVWSCTQKCKAMMKCGKHVCNQICHAPGECPPCSSTSLQPCECGEEIVLRRCSELKWKCKKVCGALYPCGVHSCRNVCQTGPCGDCPLGLPRSCPCGKTKRVMLCTETMESCGDTCQKTLSCGNHTCTQRCHRGRCQLCTIVTQKVCRCGLHTKELPCSREFVCETKCKKMRACGKHACNKKCCDGRCPPCDKTCGRHLSCKKHKCSSVCHNGPCFPCKRRTQMNCSCGKTSRQVPCGRERYARIACVQNCKLPSKCHHQPQHRCHKNDCPPCGEKCNLPNDTTGCMHPCEAKCHDAVKIVNKSKSNSAISHTTQYEMKKMPHPRCEKLVDVECFGGHEISEWPCWNSERTSCQRKCDRLLRCGIHKCALLCHPVPDSSDMKEQEGCSSCKEGCYIPRPKGCVHPCRRPCHPSPCTPCNNTFKRKCHCGLTMLVIKCSEFFGDGLTTISEEELAIIQEVKLSCGARCLKNINCGHRCSAICHSGSCPFPNLCRKKMRIFCGCKRQRGDISCDKYQEGLQSVPCDEKCGAVRLQLEQRQKEIADQQRQEEEAKNRQEVDQFEKKFGKRKPRERRVQTGVPKKPINWQALIIALCVGAAVLLAFVFAAMHSE